MGTRVGMAESSRRQVFLCNTHKSKWMSFLWEAVFLGVKMPAGMDPLMGLCGWCVCVCLSCKRVTETWARQLAGWMCASWLHLSCSAQWPGGVYWAPTVCQAAMLVSGCAGHRDLSFSHRAAWVISPPGPEPVDCLHGPSASARIVTMFSR